MTSKVDSYVPSGWFALIWMTPPRPKKKVRVTGSIKRTGEPSRSQRQHWDRVTWIRRARQLRRRSYCDEHQLGRRAGSSEISTVTDVARIVDNAPGQAALSGRRIDRNRSRHRRGDHRAEIEVGKLRERQRHEDEDLAVSVLRRPHGRRIGRRRHARGRGRDRRGDKIPIQLHLNSPWEGTARSWKR